MPNRLPESYKNNSNKRAHNVIFKKNTEFTRLLKIFRRVQDACNQQANRRVTNALSARTFHKNKTPMGRQSRATLSRITNLKGSLDLDEQPTKRRKTVPSGKENIDVSGDFSEWYIEKSSAGDTHFCQVQILSIHGRI